MIHSFAYRNPRLPATFPVEFLTEDGLLFGFAQDISERGLCVDFREPVALKTSGRVRLRTGHCLVELQAEVTHTEGFTVGLAFSFASDRESSFVRAILQVLTQVVENPDLRKPGGGGV